MHKRNNKIEVPRGFMFAAGAAGLRTHGEGPDVGFIRSEAPAKVAALFTSNLVKAAPVMLSQEHLRKSKYIAQAIVVNAGNANCATGEQGMQTAAECASKAAELLGIPAEQVLLASTGVIGVPMQAQSITTMLPKLMARLKPGGYAAVSKAILTTDTRPKLAAATISLSGRQVRILGMCKGAGMINPCLATMLAFIFTDAAVDGQFLREITPRIGDLSFNRISVDGDTSTNDTVFVMANGLAANKPISGKSAEAEKLVQALTEVARELAIKIVMDGEGARKLIEIRVEKAASEAEASAIARSIGSSALVKTAVAGADPNWGRILSAAGNAGVELRPELTDIYLDGVLVCRKGGAAEFNESALQRKLRGREVVIRILLRAGTAQSTFWTCDLTEEYIRINASYRT
ncbi:MAG: bifunctional glutamate N-acetyltransferase/amino-acid acetyltransferase ArgJ [Acidobacteria bacterium]|nr:bifunctional glutamate N-acetyltransferase/amino-acid acetyltransferase ArgJ [Acidobacteriota bacterium]